MRDFLDFGWKKISAKIDVLANHKCGKKQFGYFNKQLFFI